jgi:hypothetical protein
MADRDPVTGRFLIGNKPATVGRMKRAAKAKLEELQNSLENGEMPLDFMLRIMRDRREPGSTRFLAAALASPVRSAQPASFIWGMSVEAACRRRFRLYL